MSKEIKIEGLTVAEVCVLHWKATGQMLPVEFWNFYLLFLSIVGKEIDSDESRKVNQLVKNNPEYRSWLKEVLQTIKTHCNQKKKED